MPNPTDTILQYSAGAATSDKTPWAFVTGSTSGIGLSIACDLCNRGFNVFIHGRDQGRLHTAVDRLTKDYPSVNVRAILLDSRNAFLPDGRPSSKTSEGLAQLTSKNLRLLVNNVGCGHNPKSDFAALIDQTSTEISTIIDVNIKFMVYLTQFLLPHLHENAVSDTLKYKSLVINAGSLAELGLPWVAVYSGSKAFITAFTKALDTELQGDDRQVKAVMALIGDTDTPGHSVGKNLFTPSGEEMGRMVVLAAAKAVVVVPSWAHWLQYLLCIAQPFWLLQKGFIHTLKLVKRKTE
ncbi:NAD(P)-binding protein [Myriangium duriaei CBS 260.36]|uniref:NAD(P)-binding protein n=1 Tax=Myriangium duriaei CBS 260.36 TaxID=1168546 RepID=A0A9P4IVG3_9PEZI|nr:NAD(P)-binding protein [Myriangium duriaei CBS 260.36]